MTARQLVNHMSVQLRAIGGLLWGLGAAVAFAALLTVGFFLDLRSAGADVVRLSAAGALAALLAARVVGRLKGGDEHEDLPAWHDSRINAPSS